MTARVRTRRSSRHQSSPQRGHFRIVQLLVEAGAVVPTLDDAEISAMSPIARALLRNESIVLPAPQYGFGDNLVLQFQEAITACVPQFHPHSNVGLIDRYEMEGELPSGVAFDANTGVFEGAPSTIPFEGEVSIRSMNSLTRSEPAHIRILVTSDMQKLIMREEDLTNYLPALLQVFPTVAHLRRWYNRLDASDRSAAFDAVIEKQIGVDSPTDLFALKGVLKRIAEPTSQPDIAPITDPVATPMRPSPSTPASGPPRTSDGYRLDPGRVAVGAHIADGGQASVHEGEWQGSRVAIKVFGFGLKNKLPAKIRSAIDREMSVLSALRHPHIVQLYGYFQEERRTGVVMEFCGDGDLSKFCVDKSLFEKLSLAKQVLVALSFLHTQEPAVTHGDVKPQNVLIQNGQVKLADFGMSAGTVVGASVSVSMQSKATATGTNAYAAPEVLDGGRRALSPASDMFSFGMLVYHLVEESMPWFGEADDFILRKVTAGNLPPFESEDWTPELQQLVQGCCALDPAGRHSAEEALQRLAGLMRRMGAGGTQLDRIEKQLAELNVAAL